MKTLSKLIALAIILCANVRISNAQKHNENCECRIISLFSSIGTSLPTSHEKKNATIAGSIGVAYLTGFGNLGIDWNFNIFTLPKYVDPSKTNVMALYSYSAKYRSAYDGSHRLLYGASLDFNETHVPDGFANEKETGIGASAEAGYYFALTNIGAFGISVNYQYAKLSSTNFSNVGIRLQYGAPWLSRRHGL